MAELTPIQKARAKYERRIKEDPVLRAQRSRKRNIATAKSHIKFILDREDLFETLELTLAMILLRENTNYEEMTREERNEFLGRSMPQALLNEQQLEVIGEIMDQLRKYR